MPVCPRREKTARRWRWKGPRSRAAPSITRTFCCGLLSFLTCHLSVTDDVVVPATATATVPLFSAALITVCFVVLLAVPFPGVPLAGRAVVNGASEAVSALRAFIPDAKPGLAATVPVAPPLSRRSLRSWHPGKRPPGCKGQRRFANRASRRCGGCLPVVVSGAIHLFKPLSPGAKTATTVSASPGVKCTSRKTFCPEAGKNFCGLPPDSRFRPWQ